MKYRVELSPFGFWRFGPAFLGPDAKRDALEMAADRKDVAARVVEIDIGGKRSEIWRNAVPMRRNFYGSRGGGLKCQPTQFGYR